MPTLQNQGFANGTYAGVATGVGSNVVLTEVISDLTLTKAADQEGWASGNLTYTLTLTNTSTTEAFTDVTFTDALDVTQVSLVTGSITLNGTAVPTTDYTYNATTGLLTIAPLTPISVAAPGSAVVTFRVQKA